MLATRSIFNSLSFYHLFTSIFNQLYNSKTYLPSFLLRLYGFGLAIFIPALSIKAVNSRNTRGLKVCISSSARKSTHVRPTPSSHEDKLSCRKVKDISYITTGVRVSYTSKYRDKVQRKISSRCTISVMYQTI